MIYCSARLTQINESIVSHPSERQRGQESLVSGFAELLFVRGGQPERADSLLETVFSENPFSFSSSMKLFIELLSTINGLRPRESKNFEKTNRSFL